MNPDHERVLPLADGTVTGRQFREVGLDLKADGAAVAAASEGLYWAGRHRLDGEA